MTRFLRNNGLTLVLIFLFAVAWVGQFYSGKSEYNETRRLQLRPSVSDTEYVASGHFWQATGENWESEFLQMGLFTILTVFLFQKGSPESNDPDEPEESLDENVSSGPIPWPVRKGGIFRTVYSHSLSLTFLLLFIVSVAIHAIGGTCAANEERSFRGEPLMSLFDYFCSSRFWFESFQNWQSEFLSLAAMVFLSVYLREAGSAESKRIVASSNDHA